MLPWFSISDSLPTEWNIIRSLRPTISPSDSALIYHPSHCHLLHVSVYVSLSRLPFFPPPPSPHFKPLDSERPHSALLPSFPNPSWPNPKPVAPPPPEQKRVTDLSVHVVLPPEGVVRSEIIAHQSILERFCGCCVTSLTPPASSCSAPFSKHMLQ